MMYVLTALGSVYALWGSYLAIMCLKGARDAEKLTPVGLRLAYPLLAIGYVLDFLVNVLVMTVLLLELPREALVTARVSRHKREGSGYRKVVADWFCKHLLDPFDPSGCHCK